MLPFLFSAVCISETVRFRGLGNIRRKFKRELTLCVPNENPIHRKPNGFSCFLYPSFPFSKLSFPNSDLLKGSFRVEPFVGENGSPNRSLKSPGLSKTAKEKDGFTRLSEKYFP